MRRVWEKLDMNVGSVGSYCSPGSIHLRMSISVMGETHGLHELDGFQGDLLQAYYTQRAQRRQRPRDSWMYSEPLRIAQAELLYILGSVE